MRPSSCRMSSNQPSCDAVRLSSSRPICRWMRPRSDHARSSIRSGYSCTLDQSSHRSSRPKDALMRGTSDNAGIRIVERQPERGPPEDVSHRPAGPLRKRWRDRSPRSAARIRQHEAGRRTWHEPAEPSEESGRVGLPLIPGASTDHASVRETTRAENVQKRPGVIPTTSVGNGTVSPKRQGLTDFRQVSGAEDRRTTQANPATDVTRPSSTASRGEDSATDRPPPESFLRVPVEVVAWGIPEGLLVRLREGRR